MERTSSLTEWYGKHLGGSKQEKWEGAWGRSILGTVEALPGLRWKHREQVTNGRPGSEEGDTQSPPSARTVF
jgi:hypothetical protein